jgi:hypothetical protein
MFCMWCGQEIDRCRENWERFHRGLLDPFCYNDDGNILARRRQADLKIPEG